MESSDKPATTDGPLSTEGPHADQSAVQPEGEQRPGKHAHHQRNHIALEGSGRVGDALGAITATQFGEGHDRPHQEGAEQHHIVQQANGQQVAERLNQVWGELPAGVEGGLGPITTPLSEGYMYRAEGEG